jgi:hypothetical protein
MYFVDNNSAVPVMPQVKPVSSVAPLYFSEEAMALRRHGRDPTGSISSRLNYSTSSRKRALILIRKTMLSFLPQ